MDKTPAKAAGAEKKLDVVDPIREKDAYRYSAAQQRARQQADGFQRSTGANAVEASRRLRELRDTEKSESEVEVSRSVQGRTFLLQGGMWKEQSAPGKVTLVPIKFGSEAYFQLLSHKPEWAKFLSQGRRVAFRSGKGTMVVVDEKGKEKLTEAELKALEK
jgi:hypothetical protein